MQGPLVADTISRQVFKHEFKRLKMIVASNYI